MPSTEQRRPRPTRLPPKRRATVLDPTDAYGKHVLPEHLVQQQDSGLFQRDGIWVDGRRGKQGYDEPGYMGDLSGLDLDVNGNPLFTEQQRPFGA